MIYARRLRQTYGAWSTSLARHCRSCLQGAGRIIQFSSIGGRQGAAGLGAYQLSKFAVGGFSEVLAAEVAPLGIKVTIIEPAGFRTDWAGSSMRTPDALDPDYGQTVGAMIDRLRGITVKKTVTLTARRRWSSKSPRSPSRPATAAWQLRPQACG
jgi:NAD(P)-dependent dehydrogenase (short-subunit alcohol dehydrogenase family)